MRLASAQERATAWLFASGDARVIALLRIAVSAFLVWRLLVAPLGELSHLNADLYRPVSFMQLLPGMPGPVLTNVLLVLAMTTLGFSMLGVWSRTFLPVGVGLSLVLLGMTTSTGKIAHNDVLLLLVAIPVAFGTTDAAWSLRRRRWSATSVSLWPLHTAIVVVVGAYVFSGLAKLLHSGPYWAFSENLRWILYANSDGRAVPNEWALFVADRPWLAVAGSTGILFTELAFILVLWRLRTAMVLLPLAIGLHIGTRILLGLDYSAWIAVDTVVLGSALWLDRQERVPNIQSE